MTEEKLTKTLKEILKDYRGTFSPWFILTDKPDNRARTTPRGVEIRTAKDG